MDTDCGPQHRKRYPSLFKDKLLYKVALKLAEVGKLKNSRCWRSCGEGGVCTRASGKIKWYGILERTENTLQKQHTHLLFNLAIPLLQVHSKGTDSPNHMQAQMHEILNATEFIVAKCWTAPNYQSTGRDRTNYNTLQTKRLKGGL